jgi:predicted DNA-binding transcriptional regulator AlpA
MFKNGPANQNGVVKPVPVRDCDAWASPLNKTKDGANSQREKIRQIAKVLREAGFVSLSEQASALGLSRSTTWKLLQADHKTSGLHAGLIGRMLSHKELPPTVRLVLREYVVEKARGHYGHSLPRRRRFAAYFWDMPELADWLKKPRATVSHNSAGASGSRSDLPRPGRRRSWI